MIGTKPKTIKKMTLIIIIFLLVVLVLLIPESGKEAVIGAGKKPFTWDQDHLWQSHERSFSEARESGSEELSSQVDRAILELGSILDNIEGGQKAPGDNTFITLEKAMFALASKVAVCPSRLAEYTDLCNRVRREVKAQSAAWDMQREAARDRLYRLLYGTRAALEEVMLQVPAAKLSNLVIAEPAARGVEGAVSQYKSPETTILGVKIYSGDILVSRGGAPTSALIARGNDYPGNFSHIAL
ncbi:MAG: hypothetical protein GY757_14440, partial [bacterium]|nr:hypothetical protein [bacterium]